MPGLKLYASSSANNRPSVSPITNGTVIIGRPNGMGSTKRIINNCKKYSEGSNCINSIFGTNLTTDNSVTNNTYSLGNWTNINPINNPGEWLQCVCDSTGQYINVIYGNMGKGTIYSSDNYGNTFTNIYDTSNNNQLNNYTGILMSSNGQYCVTCAIRSIIYIASDYSQTFTQSNESGGFWYKMACDSSANVICAVKNYDNNNGLYNNVFISTDVAQSFNLTTLGSHSWSSVCVNSNGNVIVTCSYDGYVYISNNSGLNWNSVNLSNYCWSSVSIDSTGNNIVICSLDGYIYISNNGGTFWSSCSPNNNLNWSCVCISSTSNVIFATAIYDNIYYSINNGNTWTMTSPDGVNRNWSSITTNSDGSYVYACVNGGYIYVNS